MTKVKVYAGITAEEYFEACVKVAKFIGGVTDAIIAREISTEGNEVGFMCEALKHCKQAEGEFLDAFRHFMTDRQKVALSEELKRRAKNELQTGKPIFVLPRVNNKHRS